MGNKHKPAEQGPVYVILWAIIEAGPLGLPRKWRMRLGSDHIVHLEWSHDHITWTTVPRVALPTTYGTGTYVTWDLVGDLMQEGVPGAPASIGEQAQAREAGPGV
jgi:hypothetical protein